LTKTVSLSIFINSRRNYINQNKNKTNMKQIVALFAILALASCGNGTSTEVKSSDSTTVCTDSTMTSDSTAVTVDTAKVENK
jgi:ABC-type Zn uptake system ZnuABC Zn-binding protein ZnuA